MNSTQQISKSLLCTLPPKTFVIVPLLKYRINEAFITVQPIIVQSSFPCRTSKCSSELYVLLLLDSINIVLYRVTYDNYHISLFSVSLFPHFFISLFSMFPHFCFFQTTSCAFSQYRCYFHLIHAATELSSRNLHCYNQKIFQTFPLNKTPVKCYAASTQPAPFCFAIRFSASEKSLRHVRCCIKISA